MITFPHASAPGAAGRGLRVTPRWLAAAAAAGLFIGVAVGSFFQNGVVLTRARRIAPSVAPAVRPAPQPASADETPAAAPAPPAHDNDDEFLSELELALDRPHTHDLLALDELTPRVREVPVNQIIR